MTEEKSKLLYELVMEHNSRVNVTAITDYDDFLIKHIADSELGEKYTVGKKLLDIGSGGGFPALVFAINDPTREVTMTDSVGKKVNVINAIAESLALKNATAVHTRIEDFPLRETFDTVTARAVAPLRTLVEYALPFVRVGGRFVAYKSSDCDEEIAEAATAIRTLGGKLDAVAIERLGGGITRKFIIIRKNRPSPNMYPRGKNLPRLKPL